MRSFLLKAMFGYDVHKTAQIGISFIDARELVLGPKARIGHFNIFRRVNLLEIGVEIGNYSTVGGYRSQILTHSVNIRSGRQELSKVSVGSYTFIGTACVLLKGACLPDFCVLSAHSTLAPGLPGPPHQLLRGNPAIPVKSLHPESTYFHRAEGRIT
jgi:serine acetyltransferase